MSNHTVVATQEYSALFLLDFVGRYAVDRCGATEDLFNALMSAACVLPIWIWVSSIVLASLTLTLVFIQHEMFQG